ncbi:MAG: hypothetical protein RIR00_2121 [Pseudomonadota bacterium]|jgi:hypothetical protein
MKGKENGAVDAAVARRVGFQVLGRLSRLARQQQQTERQEARWARFGLGVFVFLLALFVLGFLWTLGSRG